MRREWRGIIYLLPDLLMYPRIGFTNAHMNVTTFLTK